MIRFTRHADNKFLLLKKHGLSIKRDQVIKTVEQPAYMNKKINKIELRYEPEADVLSWEINSDPIDYAKEMGNIVVHFSKKNIPVLILSNFGQESKVQQGLSLGAVDYLVKANFTTGEIVEKIRAITGKK